MKRQDWADWLHSPVTQAVISRLDERKNELISELLGIQDENLEAIAIKHIAARKHLEGLAEVLDTDSLAEAIGVEINED